MIKISGLHKQFLEQKVLTDINLIVPQGQIMVILGESGSGKSVLLKHLIGLFKPNRGLVEIDNVNIARLSEKQLLKMRRNIGYLFQEGALYDFMTVFDNVAFPLREHTRMKQKEIRVKVEHLLDLVDLAEAKAKFPAELSGGMQKRAALARSVVLDSKILLCDEPTSGLDPIRSRDISDLIRDLSKKFDCTTVVTSHDIDNALRIADQVALIKDGRIVFHGSPKDFRAAQDSFIKEMLL